MAQQLESSPIDRHKA